MTSLGFSIPYNDVESFAEVVGSFRNALNMARDFKKQSIDGRIVRYEFL